MAKRRILKKEISYVAGELFTEALVCKLYIPGVNQEKADALMARILECKIVISFVPDTPTARITRLSYGIIIAN